MAESLGDLYTMLNDLSRVYQQVGLRMNMSKAKIISNVHVPLHPVIDLYLGHKIQLVPEDPKCLEQCVLPVMTHKSSLSQSWSLTFGLIRRLTVTQRAMERAMLGVSLIKSEIRSSVLKLQVKSNVVLLTFSRMPIRTKTMLFTTDHITNGRWGPKVLESLERPGNSSVENRKDIVIKVVKSMHSKCGAGGDCCGFHGQLNLSILEEQKVKEIIVYCTDTNPLDILLGTNTYWNDSLSRVKWKA
ncbi:jg7847 [Pararge aegeria aegeria]|uniref:Jg7847 protein n=1 Tax=Pararge aegeria aegeria TaxID=348720 RepID=A0A8S4S4Y5_9NEOP|nr:jg7847 [Pararge aegeria aegeria]